MPKIIRYYLNEDPIVDNVETFLMTDRAQRDEVCGRPGEICGEGRGESGGYGMLIGPHSSREQRSEFREKIIAHPETTSRSRRSHCRPRPALWMAGLSRDT